MSSVRLSEKSFVFCGARCVPVFYTNPNTGNTCIDFEDATTGEPWGCATIPYPAVPDPRHQVVIKDYTENEGVPEILQEAGILGEYLGDCPAPFGYPIYKLLVNPLLPPGSKKKEEEEEELKTQIDAAVEALFDLGSGSLVPFVEFDTAEF